MLRFLRRAVDLVRRTIEATGIWKNMQNDQLSTLVDQSTSTSGWKRLLPSLATLSILRRTDYTVSIEIINNRAHALTTGVIAAVEDQLSTPALIFTAAEQGSIDALLVEASRPSNITANRAIAGFTAGIVMASRDRNSNINTVSDLAGRYTSAIIRKILLPAPCAIVQLVQPSRLPNYFSDLARIKTDGPRDDDDWVIIHKSRVTQNLNTATASIEESVRNFADSAGISISHLTNTLIHQALKTTGHAANWLRQRTTPPSPSL